MRHAVDGRKLGRNTSHRRALFKNLAIAVIKEEQIVTTLQKAKEARRTVDRLITLGKKGSPHNRRIAYSRTRSKLVVDKLFTTLAERYRERAGGYTRILKMSNLRRGDGAEMAMLELVDHPVLDRKRKAKKVEAPQADKSAPKTAQAKTGAKAEAKKEAKAVVKSAPKKAAKKKTAKKAAATKSARSKKV